jgi:hypothetical protein
LPEKSRTEDFNSQAERDTFLGKEVLRKDVRKTMQKENTRSVPRKLLFGLNSSKKPSQDGCVKIKKMGCFKRDNLHQENTPDVK